MERAKGFSVLALGGLGEIGMNCLTVETEGRLLIIDCGIMFNNDNLGIEAAHPKFDYLVSRREDIEGVVLSHGHEDHISGLPFLLREIDIPIYAGPYASRLLKNKVDEGDFGINPLIKECSSDDIIHLGPFKISMFPMPHSIAQNMGIVVEMGRRRILHTGDFKLNMKASDCGEPALNTLKQMSQEGVDLMLCDSTGAEENDIAGDEKEVLFAMDRLFREASQRIFVAVFSSNVRRIETVLLSAKRYGRKVTLAGRSVHTHFRAALSACGIDASDNIIVSAEEAAQLPRKDLVVLISGTQGESRSALFRIASGNHHKLKVEPGDLVILSSRFIPGNEPAIGRMIDRLLIQGVQTVHRGIMPSVHVSGHGGRKEISAAIEAVNPRCFMPIHGTYRHMTACAELAKNAGCRSIKIALNGQRVQCSDNGLAIKDEKPCGRAFIDRGGRLSEQTIKERQILAANGVVSVAFMIDDLFRIQGSIKTVVFGIISHDLHDWFIKIVEEKVRKLAESCSETIPESLEKFREDIRFGLRKFILKQISREPMVIVSIL